MATAQQEAAAPEPTDDCQQGSWRLDGAEFDAGAKVAFLDEWTPTLELVAACMKRDSNLSMCVEVQGQYDKIRFSKAVVDAFGTKEAAQIARARGRSSSVLAKLGDLGIRDARMIEQSPPEEPTYRGVRVRLIPNCRTGSGGGLSTGDARLLSQQLRELRSEQALARRAALDMAAEIDRLSAQEGGSAAPVAPSPWQHRYWLDAGLTGNALIFKSDGPSDFVGGGMLRIGGGWRSHVLFAKAHVGMAAGGPAEHRYAYEASASFGYYESELVQVGGNLNYRRASHGVADPVLDTAWSFGLEANQCWVDLGIGKLCTTERFSPIGRLARRGHVRDGEVLGIPEKTGPFVRFDLGVTMRRQF